VVVFTIYMYVVFYLLNDWLEYIRKAAFTDRWKVKVVQFVFGWVFKSITYHVKVFEVCLSGVAVYDVSPATHPLLLNILMYNINQIITNIFSFCR